MIARIRALLVLAPLFLAGCGGAEPRAEATWETHTTAADDEPDDLDLDPDSGR